MINNIIRLKSIIFMISFDISSINIYDIYIYIYIYVYFISIFGKTRHADTRLY